MKTLVTYQVLKILSVKMEFSIFLNFKNSFVLSLKSNADLWMF